MLESIKYATISNIYVKDLIFYDPEKEVELKQMCIDYGISYLPSSDRKTCYRLYNDTFLKSDINENLVCNPFDRIFDPKTIEKFEKGNHDEVMFVMENGIIKGVVHIVDYNNEFINVEFFKNTYHFEKMLRDVLVLKGETNESLLEWMKNKSLKNDFWKRRFKECMPEDKDRLHNQVKKRKEFNPFQTFYMNDLLHFIASKGFVSMEFKRNIDSITKVRNWVAHNQDLAHKKQSVSHPLYKIDELKTFVVSANNFFDSYEELEEIKRAIK